MNNRGVTLVELIVVMVIIAIGAALMTPNFTGWLAHYRLKTATRDVVSLMRSAQMKAISTNMQHRVSFTPGVGSFILQRNSGGQWFNDGTTQALPAGVSINVITLPGNAAEFNPNSTSSAGSLTLRNTKSFTKRITLTTSTGRIRVE